MSTIHIDKTKKPLTVTEKEWAVDKLRLDPENVRFRHVDHVMSDPEIEEAIWTEPDTKDLYRAIVASGGLSEMPFVTSDGVVKEGNRRLVCLRKAKAALKEKKIEGLPPGTFDKVTVQEFDGGANAAQLDIWLARVHVSGKKMWDAINQADHLYSLYNTRGYSYDDIRELLGMGKGEVIRKIKAYHAAKDYLKRYGEKDISKYSFFEELYKKRDLAQMFDGDPAFRDKVFDWIEKNRFDFTGAKDMRLLGDVLNDRDAKRAFEEKGMKAAQFEMQKKNPALGNPMFRSVKAALDAVGAMPRDVLKELKNNPQQVKLLAELRDELEQILEEVE
jgi:hypothetical protein